MDSAARSRPSTSVIGDSKVMVPSKRDLFLSTYQPHQIWSLPDSIIYYILKNPSSSKVYEKLIQSCKYFFIKNSIIVVPCLLRKYDYDNKEWKTLLSRKFVDLKIVSSKLWISEELSVIGKIDAVDAKYFISSILPKIYQCDAKYFFLYHQNITFNELIFLASKSEEIHFCCVTVKNDDGTVVALEKIVAALPNVKDVYYDFEDISPNIITSNTAHNLIKIPHFAKIKYFKLVEIPVSFDIDTFFSYIKKNQSTRICLYFCENISEQYRNRLQAIVNEIIQAENCDYRPPYIRFPGIEESSLNKLWILFHRI